MYLILMLLDISNECHLTVVRKTSTWAKHAGLVFLVENQVLVSVEQPQCRDITGNLRVRMKDGRLTDWTQVILIFCSTPCSTNKK